MNIEVLMEYVTYALIAIGVLGKLGGYFEATE